MNRKTSENEDEMRWIDLIVYCQIRQMESNYFRVRVERRNDDWLEEVLSTTFFEGVFVAIDFACVDMVGLALELF